MRDQQITPWTFLNERVDLQHTDEAPDPQRNNNVSLPKVKNTRMSASKQQQYSNHILVKNTIQVKTFKTMVLSQDYERISPSLSIPLKKKTEPIFNVQPRVRLSKRFETLNYLNEMKVVTKLMHTSLVEDAQLFTAKAVVCSNYYVNSLPTMQNAKKSVILPPKNDQSIVSIRIHDKNTQFNLSALRQIIKKERESICNPKNKVIGKKNKQIQNLKIKLTQKTSNRQ